MAEYYDAWSNTITKNGLKADLVISALQKCIRRADEDLAMRFAYELYVTSPFHEAKMWQRLLVISVEDIGFGNPEAPILVRNLFKLHKEYDYHDGDRTIFFLQAIRYLCRCKKERSTDNIKCIIMRESAKGEVPEIPEYAYDMHTIKGREQGKDFAHFLNEASKVEPLADDYDDQYRQALLAMYEEEIAEEKANY